MDLPRLNAMQDYWRVNPPAHIIAAAQAGYKPPPKVEPGSKKSSFDDVSELVAVLGTPQPYQPPCRMMN